MGTYPACYNLVKNDCKDSVDNQTQARWKMTNFKKIKQRLNFSVQQCFLPELSAK